MNNILLAGVGGQGTVLASKLIAKCALAHGTPAHTAETIGMAQRGGCVVSHVRLGENCFSPLIPLGQAHTLIAFEPAEAVRCLPYLREDGNVIVSNTAVKPVTDALKPSYDAEAMLRFLQSTPYRVHVVDGVNICCECKTTKVLNIALLGAAAKLGLIGVSAAELEAIIDTEMKEKFREMNKKALRMAVNV
ncbi:MAG TPA: indolepyruvate oxidoreductase subunit beta [Bacillota bacterium]|nr:indolepyruvate oxidoreductase subunit beta [Bacillota bacterium]